MNTQAKMIIDLKKLQKNVETLIDTYGDYKYFFASLKNNAYGMGLEIIPTLVKKGINYLYVSSLEEALEVRQLNQKIKILVNFEINPDYIYDAALNDITLTVSSIDFLKSICNLKLKDKLNLHILIDNGHNKLGLKNKADIKTALDLIKSNDKLHLEGIYTDFMTYGILDEDYYVASKNFLNVIKDVTKEYDLIVHANEPIMYHHKNKLINAIRFDLSLLGIEENIPDSFMNNLKIKSIDKKYNDLVFPNINLNLIFSIETIIMAISRAYKNSLVGKSYITKEDINVAILPIGYQDGVTKALEQVIIKDRVCPILADEIDYIMVVCPNIAKVGDKAIIIDENTNIYKVIDLLKTNRYYLMSVLKNNLTKVYINALKDDNLL